ncbi:MAG: hypothetical protein H6679_05320 [Epsilonproteobacteria bacterium]|nr:hypothetical protein [Campylobacterota bacterium]
MLGKSTALFFISFLCFFPLSSKVDLKTLFDASTPTGSMLRVVGSQGSTEREIYAYTTSRVTRGLFLEQHVQGILDQVAQREQLYACVHGSDYVVVYHAQSSLITFVQDFTTVLFDVFKNKKLTNTVPLRCSSELFDQYKDVTSLVAFFDEHYQHNIAWIDDKHLVRNVLLSVNPTLISNIVPLRLGDCSLDYFATPRLPRALRSNGAKEILRSVFHVFGIEQFPATLETVLQKIVDGAEHEFGDVLKKNGGWLLQIFIPKVLADKYLYCSLPMGRAIKTKEGKVLTGAALSDPSLLCHIDGVYGRAPRFEDNLLAMQFRLYPHPDVFLDNESGVKIFRYSRYAKKQSDVDAYWADLYNMVRELKEYEEQKSVSQR